MQRPSLPELKRICQTLLRLAPVLDVNAYVTMIENGVTGHERLGWMFAHVAACVALVDGLHPDSDAFAGLSPILAKNGIKASLAREAVKTIETRLLIRIRELYPRLDVDGILGTLDVPAGG